MVKEKEKITEAIQVCFDFNEETKNREIKGLLAALNYFNLKEELILTYNQEEEFLLEKKKIALRPVWKWLLPSN